MRLRIKLAVVVFLVLAGTLACAEKIPDIRAQGYVTDLAGIIDPATKAKIEALGAEVQQKTGAQIALVTVKSLDAEIRKTTRPTSTSIWALAPRPTTAACCC